MVSVTDGGGEGPRRSASTPSSERERLARYLVGGLAKVDGVPCVSATWVNGQRGIRMELDGRLVCVVEPHRRRRTGDAGPFDRQPQKSSRRLDTEATLGR